MQIKKDIKDCSAMYKSTITICKNGYIKARSYKKDMYKLLNGYEPVESNIKHESDFQKRLKDISEDDKPKEIQKRNLNRTKNNLIEYAAENAEDWKSFVTLTFAENESDIDKANRKFHSYIVSVKRKYPDFKYLGVPEYQKRGAIHYHMLTNLKCGIEYPKREIKKTYNKEKDKWFEIEYYDLPFWEYGYSTAFDLSMTDSEFNVALYMTKYLFKDIDNRLWGRKKILKSNNLRKPNKYYLCDNDIYKKALDYIKEKGYDTQEFTFIPQDVYQVTYKQCTTTIKQEDCITVTEIVKESDISGLFKTK